MIILCTMAFAAHIQGFEDLLTDRLYAYDVYYSITRRILMHSEENPPGISPAIKVRPLRPGEQPDVSKKYFRCRKSHGVVRLEELMRGQVVSTAIYAEGIVQAYHPEQNAFSIVDRSGMYYSLYTAYDNYRYLMYRSTTLSDIARLRAKDGVEVLTKGATIAIRMRPGDGSSVQRSKQEVIGECDVRHGLALRSVTFYFPDSADPQVKHEVLEFKDTGNDLWVPIRGRILVYDRNPAFERNPVNEFVLEVDESRSQWNVEINRDELRAMQLPSGTRVDDLPNQRSYIVGETNVPRHLDKLAENASSVIFGSLEPTKPSLTWIWIGAAFAGVVVCWVLYHLVRRRKLS